MSCPGTSIVAVHRDQGVGPDHPERGVFASVGQDLANRALANEELEERVAHLNLVAVREYR
jgi:hypothetical protein